MYNGELFESPFTGPYRMIRPTFATVGPNAIHSGFVLGFPSDRHVPPPMKFSGPRAGGYAPGPVVPNWFIWVRSPSFSADTGHFIPSYVDVMAGTV
jgi:hypothetical protein